MIYKGTRGTSLRGSRKENYSGEYNSVFFLSQVLGGRDGKRGEYPPFFPFF
jgi:hypothetical protein